MTVSGGFTQTIDWLAFTLPKAEVDDVIKTIGGDWFQSETGFRGYPVARLMTQGKTGVGKLGTGAPRSPKEVHVDLSAGIVSQWDETKLKTILAWIFAQKGHVTRVDVALDDREATVAVETVRQAVEAGQVDRPRPPALAVARPRGGLRSPNKGGRNAWLNHVFH